MTASMKARDEVRTLIDRRGRSGVVPRHDIRDRVDRSREVVLVLGLTSNSGNDKTNAGHSAGGAKAKQGKHQGTGAAKNKPQVSIQLTATAEVWVCALAADGTRVVNGQILPAGTQEGPFHSGKFDLAFGNGSVDLKVNGKPFQIQNTPSPVGYEVTPKGTHLLQPGTRPDCT